MSKIQHLVIAGASPAGMTTAADLVRQDIQVTAPEKSSTLSSESRASALHSPIPDRLDLTEALIARGRKRRKSALDSIGPKVQAGNSGPKESSLSGMPQIAGRAAPPLRFP